jgi:hypothetical protein
MKVTPNRLAHILSGAGTERNVGTAAIGYLQQLLPSQQAGVPQQVATVAARADNERKRVAANANTSALSFITISFEHGV